MSVWLPPALHSAFAIGLGTKKAVRLQIANYRPWLAQTLVRLVQARTVTTSQSRREEHPPSQRQDRTNAMQAHIPLERPRLLVELTLAGSFVGASHGHAAAIDTPGVGAPCSHRKKIHGTFVLCRAIKTPLLSHWLRNATRLVRPLTLRSIIQSRSFLWRKQRRTSSLSSRSTDFVPRDPAFLDAEPHPDHRQGNVQVTKVGKNPEQRAESVGPLQIAAAGTRATVIPRTILQPETVRMVVH